MFFLWTNLVSRPKESGISPDEGSCSVSTFGHVVWIENDYKAPDHKTPSHTAWPEEQSVNIQSCVVWTDHTQTKSSIPCLSTFFLQSPICITSVSAPYSAQAWYTSSALGRVKVVCFARVLLLMDWYVWYDSSFRHLSHGIIDKRGKVRVLSEQNTSK